MLPSYEKNLCLSRMRFSGLVSKIKSFNSIYAEHEIK